MSAPSDGSEGTVSSQTISNQLAHLVPSFDPSKDELQVYSQKVMLLLEAWPEGKYTELATRLILNCSGSAFKKLQLHQTEVTQNERKSIQKIVELLGGHWGQIDLEQKYEHAERALYKCQQKGDESADSYLARADIMWTELNNRAMKLSDLQAYVTLRGSTLTSEDKKRVLIDADATDGGSLTIKRVAASIRMLGAGFFHEMTHGKRTSKLKTYDQTALLAETSDAEEPDSTAFFTETPEDDETLMEALIQEGDEDAAMVSDFEQAASEVLQSDPELASAFNAYTEARRRLNEKARSRGFWPVNSYKGKSKGFKGPKGKFQKGHSSSRKTLQQRIMESRCRLCNKMGHWKAECPLRSDASGGSSSKTPQAPTSFVQGMPVEAVSQEPDALPLEFLNLPLNSLGSIDVSQNGFVEEVFMVFCMHDPKTKLRQTLQQWNHHHMSSSSLTRNEDANVDARERLRRRMLAMQPQLSRTESNAPEIASACFATHGSFGAVDLGATKTVIGSQKIGELLASLDPQVRQKVSRCPCDITFRFGNHGVLQSRQALVVPIHGLLLKIAVVPGSTPFLLSNTLLRMLGAVIDTERKVLHATKIKRDIPLILTSKGLFLLDLNELAHQPNGQPVSPSTADTETFMCVKQDTPILPESKMCTEMPNQDEKSTLKVVEPCMSRKATETHTCMSLKAKQVRCKSNGCHQHDPTNGRTEPSSRSNCPVPGSTVDRIDRHGLVQAPATDAAGARAHQDGLHPSLDERTGSQQAGFRTEALGQDLCSGLERGSTVGDMGSATLREVSQASPSEIHVLCDRKGGTSRADGRENSSESPERAHQGSSSHPDDAKGQSTTSGPTRAPGHTDNELLGGGDRDHRWDSIRNDLRRHHASLSTSPRRTSADSPGNESDQYGERSGSCDGFPGATTCQPREPGPELRDDACPSLLAQFDAGDCSADCLHAASATPETNRERSLFNRLVSRYTQELDGVIKSHGNEKGSKSTLDVLEIFCGSHSQLTHQCQQLGYTAERMGYEQGDLQTEAGRMLLFQTLVTKLPKHVWASPTCGPWSGFSTLNGSRSIEAWDDLQAIRLRHLEQIALCTVVHRFQRQRQHHFHWEQPRGSLMFKLPYLQEALFYLLAVDVDLCTAGDLRDPTNGKHIRKPLTIMSSSSNVVQQLALYRCAGNHEHQVIEGQVKVHGETMNRSKFTEHYPRKFARRLAQLLCQVKTLKEIPYRSQDCPVFAAEHSEAPVPKRLRLTQTYRPKLSRARGVAELPWGKRQKMSGKTKPVDANDQWSKIFVRLGQLLPRVGKAIIDDPQVVNAIRELIQDKHVKHIVACRGSSRTMAPPDHVMKGEAPYRKCIFTERGNGDIKAEEEWEPWENLAKRNIIRGSHPSRLKITVFANDQSQSVSAEHRESGQAPREGTDDVPTEDNAEPSNSETRAITESNEVSSSGTIPTGSHHEQGSPIGMTPSQREDALSKKQSKRFQALAPEERNMLVRAHKNLGHPSPERFSTLLRSQGFRAEIAQAALEFQCSVCQSQGQPRLAKPGTIRDELDFNDRVCVDGFSWTNKQGQKFHVYHIVDWATSFQSACCSPESTTSAFVQSLVQMWLVWAGAPSEMIVDAGYEFNSDEFMEFTQAHNIKVTTISTEAPYQNGKAERHGSILKTMLSKYEAEHPIANYHDLQAALWWCVQAKNACSLRKGFAPEVLVLGKHTRIPGSVISDELLPAHLLADSETAHGIQFRKQLACRESARKAFHQADNDASLRRAILRRSRPGNSHYSPGEWVMVWRPGKGSEQGIWSGPMKVVVHENAQTIWTTNASKLFRSSPEHVRPVTASEARQIPMIPNAPSISVIAQQIPRAATQGITRVIDVPLADPIIPNPTTHNPILNNPMDNYNNSEDQPDTEPEAPASQSANTPTGENPSEGLPVPPDISHDPAVETPVPEDDDDLICEGLLCLDEDPCLVQDECDLAWRFEVDVNQQDFSNWQQEPSAHDMAFLVSAAKKQRAEVKLSTLNHAEKAEFQKAKEKEIENWIKTGTISKILRDQIPYDQILRCRWILTWKDVDPGSQNAIQVSGKRVKAKARLVILGYSRTREPSQRFSNLGKEFQNDPSPNDCINGLDDEVVWYSSSISTGKTPNQ